MIREHKIFKLVALRRLDPRQVKIEAYYDCDDISAYIYMAKNQKYI